jgi:hypothetical protein
MFSCLGISRTVSKDSNSGLHMNLFRKSEKSWTKSALTLLKWFSGSGSTDWIEPMHCSITALQHYSITALQHYSITALQHYSKLKVGGMK